MQVPASRCKTVQIVKQCKNNANADEATGHVRTMMVGDLAAFFSCVTVIQVFCGF
jgi:hypothetical protein